SSAWPSVFTHAWSGPGRGPHHARSTPRSSSTITAGMARALPPVRCSSLRAGRASRSRRRSSTFGASSARGARTGTRLTASPHQSAERTRSFQRPETAAARARRSGGTLARRQTPAHSSAFCCAAGRKASNGTPAAQSAERSRPAVGGWGCDVTSGEGACVSGGRIIGPSGDRFGASPTSPSRRLLPRSKRRSDVLGIFARGAVDDAAGAGEVVLDEPVGRHVAEEPEDEGGAAGGEREQQPEEEDGPAARR